MASVSIRHFRVSNDLDGGNACVVRIYPHMACYHDCNLDSEPGVKPVTYDDSGSDSGSDAGSDAGAVADAGVACLQRRPCAAS